MTDEEAPPPAPRPGPGGTGSAATSVPAGPLPVAAAAAGKVSRSGLQAADGALWWVESRPREGGRQVLVRCTRGPDGWRVPAEVTPPGTSVRSRVHEYGGGAAVVSDEGIWVVDQDTQAWHAVAGTSVDGRATLRRLGSGGGGPVGTSVRHADGRPLPGGAWLVSVQEEVSAAGTVHRLVATPTGGSAGAVVLWEGSDFVAAPRPSPDGRLLAWVAWDHPDMPWDASTVLVAPLLPGPDGDATDGGAPAVGEPVVVAGGPGVSVGQPTWCADGSLVVLDDRSGWWLPYRFGRADLDRAVAAGAPAGEGPAAVPLVALEAEFHEPDWALGQRTVVPLDGGALAARMHRDGRDHLVVLRPPAAGPDGRPWLLEEVDQPCRAITGVATPDGRALAVSGSTAAEAGIVVVADGPAGPWHRCSSATEVPLAAPAPVARPWRTAPVGPSDGAPTAPVGPSDGAPTDGVSSDGAPSVPGLVSYPVGGAGGTDGPPPLVVLCHGGPTGACTPGYDPLVHCLTSRGIAVAGVDYRGSTGYGRAYRDALRGRWGRADVEDCTAFARSLAEAGLVDGARMAIRGTSAGGMTALAALVGPSVFAGAVAWYGVTDLAALAADTHDFESRYFDGLIGPWPAEAGRYRERSPLFAVDRMGGRVLLLQGADDPVVPAEQSARMAEALEARGVPCRLVVFPGESHGFRRAETIEAALEAELAFYADLFSLPGLP